MDVAFALSVTFTGLVIVFAVLLLLILVMVLLGKFAGEKGGSGSAKAPETPAPARVEAPKTAPVIKPAVESGIGDEVVAAIAGAIAAITGGKGRVVSVSKAQGRKSSGKGRGAWSMAGLRENTQPF